MIKGVRFYEAGEQVEQYFLIKSAAKGMASNGKPFLTLILQDKTGVIEAKLWDITEELEKTYVEQTIVKVLGDIQSYRGKLQLRIRKIRTLSPQENIPVDMFIEKAPVEADVMLSKINQCIFEMTNPKIQRITRYLMKKYEKPFLEYPAATKNHHEYYSGLAYHVVSMLDLAKAIVALYPSLNKDLLYAGVILHDLGKVIELSGPVSPSYTIEGTLLGHITLMVGEIGKAADELEISGEEVTVLQHLVLSHHGKAEWGSPKPPLIREAEVLHYIDNLDAKINMLNRVLDKTKPGDFSERLFALDNRSFYKPSFQE